MEKFPTLGGLGRLIPLKYGPAYLHMVFYVDFSWGTFSQMCPVPPQKIKYTTIDLRIHKIRNS